MKKEMQSGDRPERKRHNKKIIILRILLSLLAILLAAFLTVYCFVISKLNKLDRPSSTPTPNSIMTTPSYTEPEENNLPDETSDVGQEEVEDQAMQEEIAKLEENGGMTGMGGRSLYSVDFETNAKALQEMLYGVQAQ